MLEEHDLQLDRMLRHVGERVVEQAVAVMGDEPVDVSLIGRDDPQRRLEILAGEREPGRRVVGRADDDEHAGATPLGQFLVAPGVGDAAAGVVDVRGQQSP